jgi:hypothetical protein
MAAKAKTILTAAEILGADDLPSEDVAVPEWGGSVRVRTMTGAERDAFELAITTARSAGRVGDVRARLVAMAAVDADGKLLFTAADVAKLSKKSSRALDRVFAVASRLNGLGDDDVEDLAKNSGRGPGGGSSSA